MENLRLFVHLDGKIHHRFSIGNGERRIAMHHGQILIAGAFTDSLQNFRHKLHIENRGMNEDGVMLIGFGNLDMDIGNILQLQVLFPGRHLIPLGIPAVFRMYASQLFHGKEKIQFKMRNTPANRFTFQRMDHPFPAGHELHLSILFFSH